MYQFCRTFQLEVMQKLCYVIKKKTFFRKYAFGDEVIKLNEQIDWIKEHKEDIPLTDILKDYHENGCCFYDMPYNANTVSCFNYITQLQ